MWRLACGRLGSRCVLRSGVCGKRIRVSGNTVSRDWRKRFGDLGVGYDSLSGSLSGECSECAELGARTVNESVRAV